jgi:hypothetical protein
MLHNENYAFLIKQKIASFPSTLNAVVSSIPVRQTRFKKIRELVKKSIKPWEKAQNWQSLYGKIPLDQLIEQYLNNGYIWSRPDLFMLAKNVYWNEQSQIIEEREKSNAWFVELAATDESSNPARELLRIAPFPHEWVIWRRRGQLKVYKWNRLRKKLKLD